VVAVEEAVEVAAVEVDRRRALSSASSSASSAHAVPG
jgi:hypothetical protein